MTADLHLHTIRSDGLHEASAVVQMAAAAGVEIVSITDHDTMAAVPQASCLAQEAGLRVIPGVELSTMSEGREIHLLAYGIAPEHSGFAGFLEVFRESRRRRAESIISRLHSLGVEVNPQAVWTHAGDAAIGRPHIADVLVASGLSRDQAEAFAQYLHRGGPAYVPKDTPAPCEAIRVVHECGGVAVAAHPVYGPDADDLQRMIESGLDGIEVWHPLHRDDDIAAFRDLAEARHLLMTGGSDFHGAGRCPFRIGCAAVPDAAVNELLDRITGPAADTVLR